MKDTTLGFTIAIAIALAGISLLIIVQHKAQVHGEPILHGFYYGNGSLYHVECIAPQIQKCDPDDETYNITGFCDPDDVDN